MPEGLQERPDNSSAVFPGLRRAVDLATRFAHHSDESEGQACEAADLSAPVSRPRSNTAVIAPAVAPVLAFTPLGSATPESSLLSQGVPQPAALLSNISSPALL